MVLQETQASGLPGENLIPFRFEDLSGSSPEQFLDFLKTIDPQALIEDRKAQALLSKIMSLHYTRDWNLINYAAEVNREQVLLQNPNPVIEIKSEEGNNFLFINGAFQLSDPEHWYYFAHGWPTQEQPEFLRSEDIVPSGFTFPKKREQLKVDLGISDELLKWLIYNDDPRVTKYAVFVDIPFNKPLNRVQKAGGEAERYNYVTGEWEPSGDGIYTPSIKERVLELANRARRNLQSNQHPNQLTE